MAKNHDISPLHSIEEEGKAPRVSEPYPLAFLDPEFVLLERNRSMRMMMEYEKTEYIMQQYVFSTLVVFGSARMDSEENARKKLEKVEQLFALNPDNAEIQNQLKAARKNLEKSSYYEEARRFANIVGLHTKAEEPGHLVIITGGGPGIMEAANRGSYEAGGDSIGLNITLPHEQSSNPYITKELNFRFHYFAIRKMHFLMRAKALIFFPGGFGTLDELFESLTLIQTEKMSKVPVILFGKTYWKKLLNFEFLVEEGAIDAADLNLFQYVETAEEAWEIIAKSEGILL